MSLEAKIEALTVAVNQLNATLSSKQTDRVVAPATPNKVEKPATPAKTETKPPQQQQAEQQQPQAGQAGPSYETVHSAVIGLSKTQGGIEKVKAILVKFTDAAGVPLKTAKTAKQEDYAAIIKACGEAA